MSVKVKNNTDFPVKGSFPGLYPYEIPAKGEYAFSDHVAKVKIPTPNGVFEQEVVTTAMSLAKSAIKDFGREGLELVDDSVKVEEVKVEESKPISLDEPEEK